MNDDEAVRGVIGALNDLAIPYMVVGSLSSNVHGIARLTNDADFVLQLSPGQLTTLATRLGPGYKLDPQGGFESVTFTAKYVIDVVGSKYKFEIFNLSEDPHDQERFRRRMSGSVLGMRAWVATPEDVVIQKLRWYVIAERHKDWSDLEGVLLVQGDMLDWAYIESWCDRHGSREHLDRLRATLRPPPE
jgi:hypothetical protein